MAEDVGCYRVAAAALIGEGVLEEVAFEETSGICVVLGGKCPRWREQIVWTREQRLK